MSDDINVDRSTQWSKYPHSFRIFKFQNIWWKNVLKIFGNFKVKIIKASKGLELLTYRFVVNILTHIVLCW